MKLSKLLTFSSFLVIVSALPAYSAIYVVNNGASTPACPTEFLTIQAAVNHASSGDTVYVCAGIYPEQVSINKSIALAGQTGAVIEPVTFNVTSTDPYDGSTVIPIVLVTPATVSTAVSASVTGFIIDGSNYTSQSCSPDFVGIYYRDAGGTAAHNTVRFIGNNPPSGCQLGLGIYIAGTVPGQGDPAAPTVVVNVSQNSVHDYQKDGITVYGSPSLTCNVEYNIVRGYGPTGINGQNGIEFDGGLGVINGNTVSQNIYTGPGYAATDILAYQDNLVISTNTLLTGDYGIYSGGNASTITKNSIAGSTYDGIQFNDGSATLNLITQSPYAAIEYLGVNTATISGNTIIDADYGIADDNGVALTSTANKYLDVLSPFYNATMNALFAKRKVSPARRR